MTNPRFVCNFLHNMQGHTSHFQVSISTLNSISGLTSLYSDSSPAQMVGALCISSP